MDDASLLHVYARDRDQTAFAELVRRHIDLVHSAALRRTGGDAVKAQDVTQNVFIDLAKKAGALTRHPALPAWLHLSTRHAAANLLREEYRRHTREQSAARDLALHDEPEEPAADWTQLAPVLDAALDTLGETDRQAVVLRYFSNQPFADIAARLHTTEAAAQMRASRALEKLRRALAKRGVTSTASALGLALGANAVTAAPASVVSGVLATTASLGTSAAAAGMGLITFMTTSAKLTLGVTAVVLILGSVTLFTHVPQPNPVKVSRPLVLHSSGEKPHALNTAPVPTLPVVPTSSAVYQATSATVSALPPASPFPSSELRAWRDSAARRHLAIEPGKSLFKNETETGLYIAYLNRLALEFERDFPAKPKPEDPAYATYAQRLADLEADADLLSSDGAFGNTLVSRDPARIASLQAAYIAGTLGLDPSQESALGAVIASAYADSFLRGLSLDRMPDGDTRAWEAGRAAVNAAAIKKVRELLTPAQCALYDQLGWNRTLIFQLKAGPGLHYSTDTDKR